jgi:choline dehydrogenase-like flavoprotein
MPKIQSSPEKYDVCIVGSGAGGGMAGHTLANAGANVLMLEAGPEWDAAEDAPMFTWNYESPRRGASTTEQAFGEFLASKGDWNLDGEPYTTTEGTDFDWFRSRMKGGRTNHWGRISLRFGPDDFRVKSRDGRGEDWPIGYDDLEPYYDRVDDLIGLFGTKEGIPNAPGGNYLPPPEPRCYELLLKEGADRLNIPMIPSRLSILTEDFGGRPACHYCAQCGRGCSTYSNFMSGPVLIDPARETGHLALRTGAMVREVTTNAEGRATGVSFIDTQTRKEEKVRADVVVLAASSCESARLLLNSSSRQHPNGLGNASDTVGKYLMDSTGTSVAGRFPQLMNAPSHNCDGVGGMHLYVPWWKHEEQESLDFPRGYHFEIWGGRSMPGHGFMGGIHNYNAQYPYPQDTQGQPSGGGSGADSTSAAAPTSARKARRKAGGYGKRLKEDYRRFYGSVVGLSGRGEMVARESNYCEIDPDAVDKYGIPVLRFNVEWSDAERKQAKHMQEKGREMIEAAGGDVLGEMPTEEDDYGLLTPGRIIHETGVTRMGDDPARSVTNEYSQLHDADNVFIVDGGTFVSQPHKNPTWTIMALSMRASDYIIDQRKKGNL